MGKIKQFVIDCIEDGSRNWDAAVRGTLCGIAPMLAAAALSKGLGLAGKLFSGFGAKKAAKEKAKKMEAESAARFESDKAGFANQEGSRVARAGFLGSQLKGARALPPEVLAGIMAPKKDTSYKREVIDESKGMGWNMAGDVANMGSQMASQYMKGLGMGAPAGGAEPTSLRPPTSTGNDFGQKETLDLGYWNKKEMA